MTIAFQSETEIRDILSRYRWQLINPENKSEWEAFTNNVVDLISSTKDPSALNRAVIGAYCTVLYTAATDDGSNR